MGKTIILIHGRAPKPSRAALSQLWIDALKAGIQRDYPDKLATLKKVTIDFVHFGDVCSRFLGAHDEYRDYEEGADVEDRRLVLYRLNGLKRDDYYREELYHSLPGKNAFKETLADAVGGILSAFRVSELVIAGVAPDLREYWNYDSDFASAVRWPLIGPLVKAMEREDQIMVIAHSLGSLVAWDTFWKFSRTAEYRPRYTDKRIDVFLSIGSPLGDETVKRHLKGAQATGPLRYPANVRRWINVAALDDYVAHDETVANDFAAMLEAGLVESIEDHRILNLSIRRGKSNPHHSTGYLMHPVVAEAVGGWL